jgi:multicomponent Na+:H+ antiporter subunit C
VIVERLPYVVAVVLSGLGLFVLVDDESLVRKVVGLNLFQTGIFLVLVAVAVREGGRSPLIVDGGGPYANPLPQVLVLTAIVVGVSVTGLAAALIVRIHAERGTVDASAVGFGASPPPDPGRTTDSSEDGDGQGVPSAADGGTDRDGRDGDDGGAAGPREGET